MRFLLCLSLSVVSVVSWSQEAADSGEGLRPKYPIDVAVTGDVIFVVDLDLPGVWRVEGDDRQLFVRGTKRFRQPLNRPRCIAIHPAAGILIGDSATREIYHVAGKGAEPRPLSGGRIGIPMTLAVAPDRQSLYVGDAETRSVWRLPIAGGEPELVAPVNSRGLAFDHEGMLWALTPDDDAIHRIDTEKRSSEVVVSGRPFQYPNGLAWSGNAGLVTDGYGRSVWKFTPDGKVESWHEGDPLLGPVGIASDGTSVWVVDPKAQQLYQVDQDKAFRPRM